MARHFGLPPKNDPSVFGYARDRKPILTLLMTTAYGIIAASIAAAAFHSASKDVMALFHGVSLAAAVFFAGFGCWLYVWLTRPRFAAHFTGSGDPFSQLVRFYAKAALALIAASLLASQLTSLVGTRAGALLLCMTGGAAAGAAFQTVLAFVPAYDLDGSS